MTIRFEQEYELDLQLNYEELASRVIDVSLDNENCPYEIEVDITLTDNAGIHEINLEHRGMDAPTDVLSFPLVDYESEADFVFLEEADEYFNPESGELMLGDIVINLDRVKEQAIAYGHSNEREYAFLIAHSMLHLMGYDHMQEDEAKLMELHQQQIMERLGITRD